MNKRYRFGPFEVSTATRTVSRNGIALIVERKVFDVLVHLIAHRRRVVGRPELLQAVWGRIIVSEGAINRAVMKARRLLDGNTNGERLLKTLHRVGYRFVGEVEEIDETAGAPGPRQPQHRAARRIAVLPVRNRCEGVEWAWLSLGMMSSLIDEIRRHCDVLVADARGVLQTMVDAGAQLPWPQLVRRLRDNLHVSDVVATTIGFGRGAGDLVLSFDGSGERLDGWSGTLGGADTTAVANELARRLADRLEPSGAAAPAAAPAEPWHLLDTTRERAAQRLRAQRWDSARKLLRVALDRSPEDRALLLDHARCLVAQGDPAARAAIDALGARAKRSGDDALAVRTLLLSAERLAMEGVHAEAELALTQCLRLAKERAETDVELAAMASFADLLTRQGRAPVARWTASRALRLASELGDQATVAHMRDVDGRLALSQGDVHTARCAFELADELGRRNQAETGTAYARIHLGYCHVLAGQFDHALQHFAHALAAALRCGEPMAVVMAASSIGTFAPGHGPDLAWSDVIASIEHARLRAGDALRPGLEVALGLIEMRRGALEPSRDLLRSGARGVGPDLRRRALRGAANLLLRQGRVDEAAELADRAMPNPQTRPHNAADAAGQHVHASIAVARGRTEEAHALLLRSASYPCAGPNRPLLALDIGWLELEAGRRQQAEQQIQDAGEFWVGALAHRYPPALLLHERFVQGTQPQTDTLPPARRSLVPAPETPLLPSVRGLIPWPRDAVAAADPDGPGEPGEPLVRALRA